MKISGMFAAVLSLAIFSSAAVLQAEDAKAKKSAPSIKARKAAITMAEWPAEAKALKIVLISDLNMTTGNITRPFYAALPEKINALNPDLILFAGNFFDEIMKDSVTFIRTPFLNFMQKIKRPKYGFIAVCGDHDQTVGRENTAALLNEAGITVPPADMVLILTIAGKPFYLGLTSEKNPEKLSLSIKQAMKNKPFLLLSHYPGIFPAVSQNAPVAVLAGHTNGRAQEKGITDVFSSDKAANYIHGPYQEGKKLMFVTSGAGMTSADPEIVLVTFQ